MSRYDERSGPTRLYIGHISRRTRSRDLEDIFAKYGRIRDVDMKHDFAFVDFSDSRDADDARHYLNGRTVDGSRIVVEFAKRGPRGSGGGRDGGRDGSRHYVGRGPTPGTGRCYNCGHDGHWARDCKAGDWKNKCYRCGQRGHIERNCHNSPRANTNVSRSRSRSPVGGRRRSRSRSYSPRRHSYSRSPRKDGAKSSEPSQKKLLHSRSRSRSRSPRQRKTRDKSERSVSRSRSRSRSRSPPQRKRSYSPLHHNGENSRRSPRSPHLSEHDSPQDNNDHNGKSPDDDHLNNSRSPLHGDDGGRNRSVGGSPIHEAELQDYTSPAENGQSPGHSGQSQESAE